MYLTRMKLNMANRDTMRALAAPNLFHGAIESSFDGERKRNLWRLDTLAGETYLMLLSEEKPDLTAMANQFGFAGPKSWETLSYDNLLERISTGTRWRFRLVANPTHKVSAGAGKSGKIYAHITTDNQRGWLMKKAANHGFLVQDNEFMPVHSQWYRFRKKKGDSHVVSLLSVTYEGILTVTDEGLFRQALIDGIGREKAFGMGLLTVARM